MRETDGACQTVVCGFIQIYDGRKVRLDVSRDRVGEAMGGKRASFQSIILKGRESLDGWGGGESQHSGVV